MELKNNNIFFINDMTSLRYALPFITVTSNLLNKNVLLAIDEKNASIKYNSIFKLKDKFHKIINHYNIEIIDVNSISYVDTLFCVENVTGGIQANKTYSFQHGFDYVNLQKNNNKSTYLMVDQYYADHVKSLGNNAIVQPYPVTLWDYKNTISAAIHSKMLKNKLVTMFYPETGSHDIFKCVYEYLLAQGYEIYVKQRAKNQGVPSYIKNIVYDEVWYPSESILLPVISDFCVGFGTSAYTDLVFLNRDFIDICIPNYAKQYYKPDRKNFYSINSDYLENFYTLQLRDITIEDKLRQPFDENDLKKFLEKILV